ncbi:MAG TPA: amino acid ABC transporter substrate-binding protein [Thermodesulfobacteriota bacterium]|nr:amino acid ABC transporter substrate-binding protein [Thermodesulfobacteriota bacterium]
MKKLVIFVLIAFVITVFTFAGSGQAQEKRDFFKVGVVTSLSGELAFGGSVTKRGYDLWEDAVNAQGGIDIGGKKYKVKLVYADDQSTPATAAVAGERLITQEKVDFILGPYASGTTLALAPITEKYKMPHITGSAESPLIWLKKFKFTFGTVPPVSLNARSAIKTLAEDVSPKPKTIAILGIDDAFSKFAAEAQKIEAEKQGLKVLRYDIVPEGSDYTPSISAIKPLNPDIFAMGNHEKAAIEMIKIAKELKFNPKAYTQHYGMTTPDFRKGLGKDIENVFGNSVWTEDMKIQGTVLFKSPKEYADAMRKKFNVDPDYTEAGSTAAGIAYQEALRAIKAAPPLTEAQKEALVAALEKLNIMTFYGQVKFAAEGEFYHSNAGLQPVTLQYQGGKLVVVGPGKFRVVAPKYPTPPWDKR